MCLPCFRFSEMVSLIVVVRDIVGAREIVCVCVRLFVCLRLSAHVNMYGRVCNICRLVAQMRLRFNASFVLSSSVLGVC